jgi:hypothetical protein
MATEELNPHGFSRDIDVEMAAVKFLGLEPEKVKRMRIIDLIEKVKRFVDGDAVAGIPRKNVAASSAPKRTVPLPTVSETDEKFMTASEIHNGPPVVTSGIRMALSEIPQEQDLKGLELVTINLNVNSMCKQKDGLHKLNEHVNTVLQIASELESSINKKKELLALHSEIINDDDLIVTKEAIQLDAKQLTIISSWVNAVLDDLSILIRERQNVQLKFTNIPGGNRVKISAQMQVTTLKMKALYQALSARLECLQIPKLEK